MPRLIDGRPRGHRHDPVAGQGAGASSRPAPPPVVADALDADAVAAAVAAAEPEVVINQLTDLATIGSNMRRFDSYFETTNRLRTEGNDHLLSAARAAGARRFLAQSFGGWPFARDGALVKSEDEPLDPHPAKGMRAIHAAIRHLEDAVTGADGIEGLVLRYGFFYGPGTSIATQPERRPGRRRCASAQLPRDRRRRRASGRSPTSTTPRRPPRWPSRTRRARASTTWSTTTRRPVRRVAARAGRGRGRAAAAPRAAAARPHRGRRGRRGDDVRDPRRRQRQGQARAGLESDLAQLARGIRAPAWAAQPSTA